MNPTFKDKINTLRYQHGVVDCGQRLLHLILTTLIIGNINDIKGCLQEKLVSNNQYKNSFTKDEHEQLNKGDHKTWDISLLFKIIQKVCGLDPAGSSSWNQHNDVNQPLEYLITTVKEIRNKLVHSFHLVLTKAEMETKFTELTEIAVKILESLRERAEGLGKQLSVDESNNTLTDVLDLFGTLKEPINQSPSGPVPESVCSASDKVSKNMINNDDEEDDMYESDNIQSDNPQTLAFDTFVAAAAEGQAPRKLTWEEQLHQDLTEKFWKCAGLD